MKLSFILNEFQKNVRRNPNGLALIDKNQSMSYTELDHYSDLLAQKLLDLKVDPGNIVALCLPRGFNQIIALLAIMKADAVYLPLDPEYPIERLSLMLNLSKTTLLLGNSLTLSKFNFSGETFDVDTFINQVKSSSEKPTHKLMRNRLTSSDLPYYVIFTSGSTGVPKGVVLGEKALDNLIEWQNQETSLGEKSITLQFTPISFDVHFQEIFSTLSLGGKLILISEEDRLDPFKLLEIIDEEKVNRLYLPFVALNGLCEAALKKQIYPSHLLEVTTAGEQLKINSAISEFFKKLPNTVLYNHYGPSEAHVVTSKKLEGNRANWPALPSIGFPIAHVEVLILDQNLEKVKDGTDGELYIGGVALAHGYLHRNDLTDERFIKINGKRYYKTGDLVKAVDGEVYFLGRGDQQIKIRGHRVETGELEVVLSKLSDGKKIIVKAIQEDGIETYLCCYYLNTDELDVAKILAELKLAVPDYMIPRTFHALEKIPLTPSGKVDYKKLPHPKNIRSDYLGTFVAATNKEEILLAELWKKLLRIDRVSIKDSFFDLGGNSLLAVKMLVEVRDELGDVFSLIDIFEKRTIENLLSNKNKADEESEFTKSDSSIDGISSEEIAIIGMSGQFPGASDLEQFWTLLSEGKSGLSFFSKTELNPAIDEDIANDSNYVFIGGEFPNKESFDYKFFQMTPKESELMDPQQRKLLELAFHALEDSGNIPTQIKKRVGVFAGMGNSLYREALADNPDKIKGQNDFNIMLGLEKDYIATRLAFKLDLTGPALSVHTGCSTSLVAIIEAVKSLRLRECELAIAGGISISGRPNSGHLFQEGGILSRDGRCVPFDEKATGTIFTDGGGIVVLKRLSQALIDNDKIYAIISGVGLNNDGGQKSSFTAPSSNGQYQVIKAAQRDAARAIGRAIDSIQMIEAHGTATPVGDPIEVDALYKAYGKNVNTNGAKIVLTSLKSNVGHLTAAAGVGGVIKTALSLKHKKVPGIVGFSSFNPLIDKEKRKLFEATDKTIAIDESHLTKKEMWGAVSSFGVGGTNAHLIMRSLSTDEAKHFSDKHENLSSTEIERPQILRLSAKNTEALILLEKKLLLKLLKGPTCSLKDISYSLLKGRYKFDERSAYFIAQKDLENLKADLEKNKITIDDALSVVQKKRVQFKKQSSSKIVFLMPGQGSHYIKMGQSLAANNSLFKTQLEKVFLELKKVNQIDYQEILYSSKSKDELEDFLKNTYYSQPIIFAIELALANYLKEMGIIPHRAIGHSIGEYATAVMAGIFDTADACFLITERARLMTKIRSGKMLSVACRDDEAKTWSKEFGTSIAAINSSDGKVFSGESKSIEKLKIFLEANQRACIELKTSHAFHSHMMNEMRSEYKKALDKIRINKNQNTMMIKSANSQHLPTEVEYWLDHAENPVDFFFAYDQLLNEYFEEQSHDSMVFVEVGPKNILSSYIQRDLRNKYKDHLQKNKTKSCIFLQTLGANKDSELGEIAKLFSTLWCLIDKTPPSLLEYGDHHIKMADLPNYPFEVNSLWLSRKGAVKKIEAKIQNNIYAEPEAVVMSNNHENRIKNRLEEKLVEIFESTSGIDVGAFSKDTSFLEMGMDSLFLTQISLQLKKELKVNVGFRQLLEDYESIEKLADHLGDKVDIGLLGGDVTNSTTVTNSMTNNEKMPTIPSISVEQQSVVHQFQQATANLPKNIASFQTSSTQSYSNELSSLIAKQLEVLNTQLLLLQGNNGQQAFSNNQIHSIQSTGQVPASQSQQNTSSKANEKKNTRGVDVKKSKDSFGAQAKIIVEKTSSLDSETLSRVKEFFRAYNDKTRSSKKFAQDNRKNHADPRVVTGFKPESKEVVYPIVVNKSHMQTLWDLDGNQYIDMTCGFGSNFFGNGNERIKKYVLKQIEDGIEVGPQHPLVSEVSHLINELTGNERTAFCNTGSEAVLGAMRLARTVTGREKIIVFSGSYHGINDEVIIRGSKNLTSFPAAPGINTSAVSNMIVLDYGTDETLAYIKEHSEEVAAVLVEPVQSRRSDFHPVDFLKEVRKITEKTGTCLIFDEIITGFRVHPAGAQGYFGIRADLCTYGKIIGGGMSIGAISGKSEYMDALDGGHWQYGDDSTPTVGVTYFAGTFVRHPLALAAAKGALEILKEGGLKKYNELNETGNWFANEINRLFKANDIPIKMDNFGSLMKPKWLSEIAYGDLFYVALRFNGVHVYDGFPWFVNLAHTKIELDTVLSRIKKSIEMMQEVGVFKSGQIQREELSTTAKSFDAKNPPVKGARIGLDELGHPGWYIEDPERPGEFFKLKN